MKLPLLTLASTLTLASAAYKSEYKVMEDHTVPNDFTTPVPSAYLTGEDMPEEFSWGDVDGVSYLTRNLNQHLPHYCGRLVFLVFLVLLEAFLGSCCLLLSSH